MTFISPDESPTADGKYSHGLINSMYHEAVRDDEDAFKEMRMAIRLHVGQHFKGMEGANNRPTAPFKSTGTFNELRLTMNHIPRIAGVYVNEIMSQTPDIIVTVKDEGDIRASRLAEMNKHVWEEHKKKVRLYEEKMRIEALNGIVMGEVAVKLYWDEEKAWVKEEPILPFDLLRAPGIRDVGDSPWYIHRRIYREDELRKMFGPERGTAMSDLGIAGINNHDFLVFNSQDREYAHFRGTEVREFYLRPNMEHPQGLFTYYTEEKILRSGPLPGGLFPIVIRRLESSPILPRGHSFIRTIYAAQMEINRAVSQDANNMYHFGSDKVITSGKSSVTTGRSLHGISHLKVSGILPLKDSIQYVEGSGMPKYMDYIHNLVKQMDYQVNLETKLEEKKDKRSGDITFVLYSRIKDKQRFSTISTTFEGYLREKAESVLQLLRYYLGPNDIIHAGNRQDTVLIEDFKNTSDLDYTFSVDVGNETPETIIGKQMVIQMMMQYMGKEMGRDDIGLLLRNSVLGNDKALLANFTANYDAVVQNMIFLEKGLFPTVTGTEDFEYKAKYITLRMGKADFMFLNPQIQQGYQQFLLLCEQKIAQNQENRMRLDKGAIPAEGPLVKTDMVVNVPTSTGTPKQVRLALPMSALVWLKTAIDKQNQFKSETGGLPPESQNRIMDQMDSFQQMPMGDSSGGVNQGIIPPGMPPQQ